MVVVVVVGMRVRVVGVGVGVIASAPTDPYEKSPLSWTPPLPLPLLLPLTPTPTRPRSRPFDHARGEGPKRRMGTPGRLPDEGRGTAGRHCRGHGGRTVGRGGTDC